MISASYCTKIRDILIHSCLIFAFRDRFPRREKGVGFRSSRIRLPRCGYCRQISGRDAAPGMRIRQAESCAAENNKILAKPLEGELVRCLQREAVRDRSMRERIDLMTY
jgi:hypothetical protein